MAKIQAVDFSQPFLHLVDEGEYILLEDYVFTWQKGATLFRITVPKHFNTDIASTPRGSWTLGFLPDGLHRAAAIIHDWLYYHKGRLPQGSYQVKIQEQWVSPVAEWKRKEADSLFLQIMEIGGVPWLKRHLMYRAVRFGGGAFWKE